MIKKDLKYTGCALSGKKKQKFSGESLREAPFSKGVLSIVSIKVSISVSRFFTVLFFV